jgi:hypothetical protein
MTRKPWFLLMTPADANHPDSRWTHAGAVSRGKLAARPIAAEGWLATLGFVVLIAVAPLPIWLAGLGQGYVSLVEAITLTVIVVAAIVAGFVWLVRSRSTRLPHQPPT